MGVRIIMGGFAVAAISLLATTPIAAQAHVSGAPASSWQANGRVRAIAVANGRIYIGGSFTKVMPPGSSAFASRAHLAALDARTGSLLPWNPGANGDVAALRVIGRRVFIGGSFTSVGGHARAHLAAVRAGRAGAVVPWHASADAPVTALASLGTRLYVGGDFLHLGGLTHIRLGAVSITTGAVARRWHPTANHIVHALAVDARAGTVYAGGEFTHASGHIKPFLAAFGWRRGRMRTFSSTPAGRVWGLSLSASALYAAVGGHSGGQLAAYAHGGSFLWRRMADGDVQAVAYSNGQVFAGGHFANACGTNAGGGNPWVCSVPVVRARLLVVDAETGSLQTWNPGADSKWGVWSLRVTPGLVVAGGDFVHIGGVHQQGVARFIRS